MAGPPPPTLFPDERAERRQRLQAASSELRKRFPKAGLTRAALLKEEEASPNDNGDAKR